MEGGNPGADGPKPNNRQDDVIPEVEDPEAGDPEVDSEVGPDGKTYTYSVEV